MVDLGWQRSKLLWVFLALITAVLAAAMSFRYALVFLDVGEPPQKSDAIFVLLGDTDTRPFVGAALYNVGLGEEVILSRHVQPRVQGNEIWTPAHEVSRNILLKRGVPESDIRLIGPGSENTMNESEALRTYLREHERSTVTVVTTHYHTRRTRWSLRRQLGRAAKRLRFVSAPHDDFDHANWWRSMVGFEVVTMEYIKLLIYWFRYGNAIWIFAAFAALGIAIFRRRRGPHVEM